MKRILLIAMGVCLAATVYAEEAVIRFDTNHRAIERWTAADFTAARPLSVTVVKEVAYGEWKEGASPPVDESGPVMETFPSRSVEPTLSGAERNALHRILFDPDEFVPASASETEVFSGVDLPSKNCGTDELHYTSSRLIPSSANTTFPYSAVGKLFFYEDGIPYYCTAAVIGRRLIATNGDCLYREPYGWHTDVFFAPAYYRGEAPLGTWLASGMAFWADYYYQNLTAGPWGIVELADQDGYSVADYTGRLANVSRKMTPNHLLLLGYGDDLDSGEELHQVMSGGCVNAFGQLMAYGSDMVAPGAPWVQNFNRKAAGQGGGRNRARAAIVGIETFWVWTSSAPRSAIGREINANFKRMRQEVCAWQPGNC